MDYRQPFEGDFPITQKYGEKDTSAFHTGIDYACPEGTPILASESGRVVEAGWDISGYGKCVIIYHTDGQGTLYAHLSQIIVYVGQEVKRSQVIGYSGNTGNSTGPHLHFEARHDWTNYRSHFDPMTLPMRSVDDSIGKPKLKGADALGWDVEIVCPAGAWGWNQDFSKRVTVFPEGTELHFTGKTTERLGYTYCEVYPEPQKYWVAVNDGETQILANQTNEKGGENEN